ncbi:MAG: radical SAM protein [Candidatus Diapherotrites archaeon]|nr:radical SAM protein [Candidatus Diapherotrites archaeon]
MVKKMRILLLNPPFIKKFSRTSRSPGVSKGGCVYYPLWLAYAAGALEKTNHEVLLLDASGENLPLEETLSKIKKFDPEMIIVDTVTPSFENDSKIVAQIKKEISNALVVFVGDHVSVLPKESLKKSKADAVAIREYDLILLELADALENNKSLSNVKGIAWRKGKKIILNKEAEPPNEKQLDWLPFVSQIYAKHLKLKNYFYPSVQYPQVTILTGRGCPNRCAFCKWPQTFSSHNYRKRSVKSVVDEFEWIQKNLPQIKEVMIEDDTLTQDKQRTIELCKALIEKKIRLPWSCNARADVPLEVLQWMKKAKCRLMCVGIESADQEILNNIHKGTTPQGIRQFMKDSKKADILVHGCFMFGNQGETKETIRKTAAFARELNPDTAQFFPVMVYPGTETYKWAKKKGYLKAKKWGDWLNEDGTHRTLLSRPGLSAENLNELTDESRRAFYARPKYVVAKTVQAMKNPKEIPRLAKGSITFAKYLLKK